MSKFMRIDSCRVTVEGGGRTRPLCLVKSVSTVMCAIGLHHNHIYHTRKQCSVSVDVCV